MTTRSIDITKAYKCKVCPYMTRFKSNLLKHIRVHTGEKPFACQYCGKRFSSRSNHKNHEERHAEQGQQYLRCPYDNCQFQSPQAEVMQDHLVDKHPYGKLRIFRGADGSAVIREKGAYGNHMVEVANMSQEVEVANLTQEIDTSSANAASALNAVNFAGLTAGSAANQLNQAAQLATGLSLWNMAMPVATMNSVTGLVEAPGYSIAQHLAAGTQITASNAQNNVINIAPADNDESEAGDATPSREKLLSMSPEEVLGLVKSSRFPRKEEAENSDDPTENGSNTGSHGNGNGNTTDSETNDENLSSQVNGSIASPITNGKTTSRRFNRRKATAPSHIRQRQVQTLPDHESGQDASEVIDKLVDEGALYRCDACNILFPEYSVYVLHLGCHGSGDNYECHFCKIIFDDKFGFLTHFTNCVKSDQKTSVDSGKV